MKDLNVIIKQDAIYLHDWSESQKIGLISDFEDIYMDKEEYEAKEAPYKNVAVWVEKKAKMKAAIEEWQENNILFATYTYENYSGDAWVLFEKGGELYEVNGGHCSCHGLEGQFEPEKTTLKELEHRLLNGTWGEDSWNDGSYKKELCDFLGVEYKANGK